MEGWTWKKLRNIKDIQQKSVEKDEYALAAYSLYIARMLNGLCQMEGSMFHDYEKRILWRAMELFTSYYEQQAEIVLSEEPIAAYRKQVLLADIEDAVFQIVNVYKNMVDGTSNSDRNLFSSLSVDSNIYELSPKLYKYYSEILEKIVEIFNAKDLYAFLLHPTIKSRIEVKRVFNEREKPGKVVLIFLPENKSNNLNTIPIYLLHEAYHILPRDQRCLKLRAKNLFLNMCEGIQQLLFFNIRDIEDWQKENFMKMWFPFKSVIDEMKAWGEESKQFHSKEIIPYLHEKWKIPLYKVMDNLGECLAKGLAEQYGDDGTEYYDKLIFYEMQIRKNVLKILGENWINQLLHHYMHLYKECLADACMAYTLPNLKADQYDTAFEETIPFGGYRNGTSKHMERELRTYIVGKSVVAMKQNDNLQEWGKYVEDKKTECFSVGEVSKGNLVDVNDFRVQLTSREIDRYTQYLLECITNIQRNTEALGCKEKLGELRKMLEMESLDDILMR